VSFVSQSVGILSTPGGGRSSTGADCIFRGRFPGRVIGDGRRGSGGSCRAEAADLLHLSIVPPGNPARFVFAVILAVFWVWRGVLSSRLGSCALHSLVLVLELQGDALDMNQGALGRGWRIGRPVSVRWSMNRGGESEEGMWEVRGIGWINLLSKMDFNHRNGFKYFRGRIVFRGIPIVPYRAHPSMTCIAHFWTG
jgi:hypothetical protein